MAVIQEFSANQGSTEVDRTSAVLQQISPADFTVFPVVGAHAAHAHPGN